MSQRNRESELARAGYEGRLPAFGDLIESTAPSSTWDAGLFVRLVRVPSSRPNAGPWLELTDGRGAFWLADPTVCRIGRRQRLSIVQAAALLSLAAPEDVPFPAPWRDIFVEGGTAENGRQDVPFEIDAEIRNLTNRAPALVAREPDGVLRLLPAGMAAVALMTEVDQMAIARRILGEVRRAQHELAKEGAVDDGE